MTYYLARRWSRNHGVNLGREGAIGSHAVQALHAQDGGVCHLELWPASDENQRAYSDSNPPPSSASSESIQHHVMEFGLIDTFESILDKMAAGFTVATGIPIPEGFLHTDDTGRFRVSGSTVGGHELEAMDYDEDADQFWFGNSWARAHWGFKSPDPCWAHSDGYTNMGFCSIDEARQLFRGLHSGEADAVVINTVTGWAPKVTDLVGTLPL